MKIVKLGTVEKDERSKGTYGAVKIDLTTIHKTANTALVNDDVDLSQVGVKVTLTRDKTPIVLLDDNIDNLIRYVNMTSGYHKAVNGLLLQPAAAGVFETKQQMITLPFGIINVSEGADTIVAEVTSHRTATYDAAHVDTAASLIEFELEPAIGYETYIPQVLKKTIQEDQKTFSELLGDNIMKLMFINKDQTDLKTPVIDSVTLTSDRIQWTKKWPQLLHFNLDRIDTLILENWGITRGLFANPQDIIFIDGTKNGEFMHAVKLDINFEEGMVDRNMNYVMYTKFIQTPQHIAKAREMKQKHDLQNQAVIFENSI